MNPRMIIKTLAVAKLLGDEELEDIRENIEAPMNQLNESGKSLVRALQGFGINNQKELDEVIKINRGLIKAVSEELEMKLIYLLLF